MSDAKHISQVPQTKRIRTNGESTYMEKATRSITAYIEKSSHFFVLCPSVRLQHKKDVTYDYGSWLASSGCRMELLALLLARSISVPAIVSSGLCATFVCVCLTANCRRRW